MKRAGVIPVVLATLALAGCGWMPKIPVPFIGGEDAPHPDTIGGLIADLPEVEVPTVVTSKPTREEVMDAYRKVYGAIPDVRNNSAIGKRLADLEMEVADEQLGEADVAVDADQPYGSAIALYEKLLLEEGGEDRDQILYQLARAHDVAGQGEAAEGYLQRLIADHPNSDQVAEARFRRAEMAFSRSDFRQAASDYAFVVEKGDQTPYEQNAMYMLGWCRFKLGDLEAGLASFFGVIGSAMAEGTMEDLPAVEQELVNDTLRVVVLALAYLDGAESLSLQMQQIGKPDWQYYVYERLAGDLIGNERYLDAVGTFDTFIAHNALDRRAPAMHERMIQTLIDGGFPSDIRPKKEEFINRYGIKSEFWERHEPEVRAAYLPTLKSYLEEMSKLAHAEAQEGKGDYLKAADWYEQMVATFPEDPSTGEYLFLLGEVYTEAGEPARAVAAYQRVVREFADFQRANEAGYAAVLGLDTLIGTAPDEELELWQRLKIDAQIEFAMMFPDDTRSINVQADAADSLFALQQYAEAIELAQHLINTRSNLDDSVMGTALAIIGHGRFEEGAFMAAETAYRQLLAIDEIDDRAAIEERLLATVYKQGEAAEAEGSVDAAVSHYLRIAAMAPTAALAAQGHFDAIATLEAAGSMVEAAALLEEFRRNYPENPLGADSAKRLASMYETSGDRRGAAREYLIIAQSNDETEVKRQALYRAAELYLELADTGNALAYFTEYANTYAQPVDLRLEAIHQLDLLYQQTGDFGRRLFWLGEKIDLHRTMGRNATDRATYLAADASMVLARDEKARFEAIHLSHPLPESLKSKTTQLTRTVKAFESVAAYEVAEFATAATFEIADTYTALSESIMASDRPNDLSDLELEQYEILLEEQSFPFEEQAISIHEINMRRSWDGVYDDWVEKSFDALSKLMPARFMKQEVQIAYVDAVY